MPEDAIGQGWRQVGLSNQNKRSLNEQAFSVVVPPLGSCQECFEVLAGESRNESSPVMFFYALGADRDHPSSIGSHCYLLDSDGADPRLWCRPDGFL